MDYDAFQKRLLELFDRHEKYLAIKNEKQDFGDGFVDRYHYPVLTAEHAPLHWRYDLNYGSNPHLLERLGVNSVFNAGAIELDGKFCLIARVEGYDRKSFFAVAESENGIDCFRFRDYPISLSEADGPDVNVYDMRVVKHQDGWIYGVFCTERKDPDAPPEDLSSAVAQCGIARTRDLENWERLQDIVTPSPQQRNVVLHPELFQGKYAFYTRPQDKFVTAGSGGGICWGLVENIENARIDKELLVDERGYHTIKEAKNGLGPAPLKTNEGWLHLAHGVRNTAAGLRYVLYVFMTDLAEPYKVVYEPGGYFLAPRGAERVGDVSNVLFANGWIVKDDVVYIYYASSDTRIHVATIELEKLLDYVKHTPTDAGRSRLCVDQRKMLIQKNMGPLLKIRK